MCDDFAHEVTYEKCGHRTKTRMFIEMCDDACVSDTVCQYLFEVFDVMEDRDEKCPRCK